MPRILTYNVHRCVGTDRRLDVARVADAIAEYEPDIVALQELDVLRLRTGMVDQAHQIAERLEMAFRFHPAMRIEEELYGDAILTVFPEKLVQAAPLPFYGNLGPVVEPRGALWIKVDIDGTWVNVINTHLGLVPREQQIQARALAGEAWIKHPLCTGPTILLGDFNATAGSQVCRTLTRELRDARAIAPHPHASTSTYPSKMPILRIDHVFVSDGIAIKSVTAPYNARTRVASDHLPLVVDFEVSA